MSPAAFGAQGPFESRYVAFLDTITGLRPDLHRYCARMTGSVMDGEDVVQEALFQAYRKLDTFDSTRPLKPWLFQVAHNRCIDFIRHRAVRQQAETEAMEPDSVDPSEPVGPSLGRAVEHLATALPPKERACVLLKDVFDYSLEDIAELVDSTEGGVETSRLRLLVASGRAGARSGLKPGSSLPTKAGRLHVRRPKPSAVVSGENSLSAQNERSITRKCLIPQCGGTPSRSF